MQRKYSSWWGGLPGFCALVPIVGCFSYGITLLVVGARVGRQSSTFGLGVGLAIMAGLLLAGVGLVVGRLAAHLLRPVVPGRWTQFMRWCAPLLLVVVGAIASWQAAGPIYAAEREARPRVIQGAAQFSRSTTSLPADGIARGSRVYDHLQKLNAPIPWAGDNARLTNHGTTLEVSFASAGKRLHIPLPGIDYINYVDAMPLTMGASGRPALALLITGRATGRRDLLAVISASGELVYLELLDRFWNPRSVALAMAPSAAGDLILVGSDPGKVLVFTPADSA